MWAFRSGWKGRGVGEPTATKRVAPLRQHLYGTVRRALELDDQLGEAHAVLGLLQGEAGDVAAAETTFKRALELSPSFAETYSWYANLLR